MEKNSRSNHHSILIALFYFATSIIGLLGCGYAPSVDKVNKIMLQEKEKFDYLISVSDRLESKFYQYDFKLNIDYNSYRSNFFLSEMKNETTIKELLYFGLDNIGNKKLENNDSFKKYMSADILPMFDSVIQIRKDLNCRNISINKSVVIIEYINNSGDSIIQVIHYNVMDSPFAPVKPNCDVHEIDTLNQKHAPYGYQLDQDNWYYIATKAIHGIS